MKVSHLNILIYLFILLFILLFIPPGTQADPDTPLKESHAYPGPMMELNFWSERYVCGSTAKGEYWYGRDNAG